MALVKEGKHTDSIQHSITIDDTYFLYYHTFAYSFFSSTYIRTRSTLANGEFANPQLEQKLGNDETLISYLSLFACACGGLGGGILSLVIPST
jgi:hypothetical protein